jgi:hypothetical protein
MRCIICKIVIVVIVIIIIVVFAVVLKNSINLFPGLSSDRKSGIRDLKRIEAINITWCERRNFTDRFYRQIQLPTRGDLKITDMLMETARDINDFCRKRTEIRRRLSSGLLLCAMVEVYRRFRGSYYLHHRPHDGGTRTSETSVNFFQITWRNNPEDSHVHTRCRENLEYHELKYAGNIQ